MAIILQHNSLQLMQAGMQRFLQQRYNLFRGNSNDASHLANRFSFCDPSFLVQDSRPHCDLLIELFDIHQAAEG